MQRLATVADLDALCRLEEACFLDRKFKREHVAWILQHPHAVTVLDEDSALRGALMMLVDRGVARVLSVAVHPDHRHRGIATALLESAEALSLNRGAVAMRLEVGVTNDAAIALYRRLGYRTGSRIFRYYSWGEDAYQMEKPLVVAPAVVRRAYL